MADKAIVMPAQFEGCPVSKESIDSHLFRFIIKAIPFFHLLWLKGDGAKVRKCVFCINTQSAHNSWYLIKCYNRLQQTAGKYYGWRRRYVWKDGFQNWDNSMQSALFENQSCSCFSCGWHTWRTEDILVEDNCPKVCSCSSLSLILEVDGTKCAVQACPPHIRLFLPQYWSLLCSSDDPRSHFHQPRRALSR